VDRSTSREARLVKAANKKVRQTSLLRAVANPLDRETSDNSTEGGGNSDGFNLKDPWYKLMMHVWVEWIGGFAVLSGWGLTRLHLLFGRMIIGCLIRPSPLTRLLALFKANVFRSPLAATDRPVSQWPTAMVQRSSGPPPRETSVYVLSETGEPPLTDRLHREQKQPNNSERGRNIRGENFQSTTNHRSISENGYGSPGGRLEQHAEASYFGPQVRGVWDPSIILPTFDGYGVIQLFLQRFEAIANHFKWSPEEQLFRMKQRITGDAEYVLGEAIHITSTFEFINMLKEQFGSEAHAERYRAELTRLRRGTLTLEQLHLRVRTLVSRAMPRTWNKATEIYARDAFLSALGDEELRRRITMACSPPETLSAVFDLAVRASGLEVMYHSGQIQESDRRENKHRKFTKISANEDQREILPSNEESGLFDYRRLVEDQRRMMNELESCRQR
jgi:hypothetical protein